jgi:chorismate mutase-like protein
MKTRDELRAEIDAIDTQLLELLNRRAGLAVEIARLKAMGGVPVLDPERERAVIGRACGANAGPLGRQAVERIFRAVMRESRLLQARTVRELRNG